MPYDQWLTTHLDTSRTIKQAKHRILSKCNLGNAPDIPRYRPTSPITFASTVRSRGGSFEANHDNDDDNDEEDSSSVEKMNLTSQRSRSFAQTWHSQPLRRSESADDWPDTVAAAESKLSARYTISTFLNAHILDNDFRLAWYNLRPYELLEIHSADSIIRLPREVMAGPLCVTIHTLRRASGRCALFRETIGNLLKEAFVPRVGSKLSKGRLVSSDPLTYGMFREKEKKKQKQMLEWRERWVVIHQGVLSLCKDRSVSSLLAFVFTSRILSLTQHSFPCMLTGP